MQKKSDDLGFCCVTACGTREPTALETAFGVCNSGFEPTLTLNCRCCEIGDTPVQGWNIGPPSPPPVFVVGSGGGLGGFTQVSNISLAGLDVASGASITLPFSYQEPNGQAIPGSFFMDFEQLQSSGCLPSGIVSAISVAPSGYSVFGQSTSVPLTDFVSGFNLTFTTSYTTAVVGNVIVVSHSFKMTGSINVTSGSVSINETCEWETELTQPCSFTRIGLTFTSNFALPLELNDPNQGTFTTPGYVRPDPACGTASCAQQMNAISAKGKPDAKPGTAFREMIERLRGGERDV